MKNDKGRGIPRGPSVFEITAEGLAAESATAWTPATMGRKGGSAKTPAKTAAARQNGRKGGRPPKAPETPTV